jgi:hypothetical protein
MGIVIIQKLFDDYLIEYGFSYGLDVRKLCNEDYKLKREIECIIDEIEYEPESIIKQIIKDLMISLDRILKCITSLESSS